MELGSIFVLVIIGIWLYQFIKKSNAPSDLTEDGSGYETITVRDRSELLLDLCEKYIDKYESANIALYVSCKGDLIEALTSMMKNPMQQQDTAAWGTNINYDRVAHLVMANMSYDLLVQGRYSIGPGQLNPTSCAPSLLYIYDKCMEYAVANGEISEEDCEKQRRLLMRCISNVDSFVDKNTDHGDEYSINDTSVANNALCYNDFDQEVPLDSNEEYFDDDFDAYLTLSDFAYRIALHYQFLHNSPFVQAYSEDTILYATAYCVSHEYIEAEDFYISDLDDIVSNARCGVISLNSFYSHVIEISPGTDLIHLLSNIAIQIATWAYPYFVKNVLSNDSHNYLAEIPELIEDALDNNVFSDEVYEQYRTDFDELVADSEFKELLESYEEDHVFTSDIE